MSRAIAELIADPREAQRLGDNARRFVVQQCENREYAGALAALIREVVVFENGRIVDSSAQIGTPSDCRDRDTDGILLHRSESAMKILTLVVTYNEAGNISRLIPRS